jgi:hypothetical protein
MPLNTARLPPDYIARVKALLLPHVTSKADRDALLIEAFHIRAREIKNDIDLSGSPNTFTLRCIGVLLDRNCATDGTHPLAWLLRAVPCGVEGEAEVKSLVHLLEACCGDDSATFASSPPRPDPVTIIINNINTAGGAYVAGDVSASGNFIGRDAAQSVNTPSPQRTPTVFLCYSHEDAAAARRVIAGLQAAGHAVWVDTADINRGEEWVRGISEGINNSYAVVVLCSRASLKSRWVKNEILWAQQKGKHIIPALLEDVLGDDGFLPLISYQAAALKPDFAAGLQQVIAALPRVEVLAPMSAAETIPLARALSRRALELEYLDRLRLEELLNTDKYTPLAGSTHREARITLGAVVMRQEFEHLAWREDRQQSEPPRKFENAVDELLAIKRAAVLGEPGAGKSTTLWKLARHLLDTALDDPKQPIPLLIKLGQWTNAQQLLPAFIARQLGELGAHLPDLLREGHAALLLDGLNEVPTDQRAGKIAAVRAYLKEKPQREVMVVVTCREQDYGAGLELDRVEILPLDPARILEFAQHYLGEARGEVFFWKLAGDTKSIWEKWQRAGATFMQFFDAPDVPRENPNVYSSTSGGDDEAWRKHIQSPGSLIKLARNPYMLFMLIRVYQQYGDLPANRGKLFEQFVETLLLREGAAEQDADRQLRLLPKGERLISALEKLSYAMQTRRVGRKRISDDAGEAQSALTVLKRSEAGDIMNNQQLLLAASASILEVGSEVRFSHQLVQEYFAACYMRREIEAGRLRTNTLWPPDRFWERTGWEEATVLLAGLYSDDCTRVIEWVADANPEVAAQCILRSGAVVPDATLLTLRGRWLPRLTDIQRYTDPRARAAVGRALGLVRLRNGELLDHRKGVSIIDGIPDIDWVEIPAGEFIYQNEKSTRHLDSFSIARYPITNIQFQAFIDAPDGFHNPRWWVGLSASENDKSQPDEQWFKYWNHPRERVSWYDAIAYCRWLSEKLDIKVTLPTEAQ